MDDINRTEWQEREAAWRKERQEMRDQTCQLKSEIQQHKSEVNCEKRIVAEKQHEIDMLIAERDMLRNNQSGFDGERVYLMGEVARFRHECDESRGFVRGLEMALSTLGRPVERPMLD